MTHSEEIDQIMEAIFQVQHTVPPLKRESEGSTGNRTYKYVPLDKVWEAASAAIKANQLAITQSPTTGTNFVGNLFQTTIFHIPSKQWISETMGMNPAKDDPQGIGSAITYFKRYTLVSMLGLIVQGDDNDAADHKMATARQKALIIGAVKQIFPDLTTDADIIKTIQNIIGKHPSYLREDEAQGALEMVKAFTAKAFEGDEGVKDDGTDPKEVSPTNKTTE